MDHEKEIVKELKLIRKALEKLASDKTVSVDTNIQADEKRITERPKANERVVIK